MNRRSLSFHWEFEVEFIVDGLRHAHVYFKRVKSPHLRFREAVPFEESKSAKLNSKIVAQRTVISKNERRTIFTINKLDFIILYLIN